MIKMNYLLNKKLLTITSLYLLLDINNILGSIILILLSIIGVIKYLLTTQNQINKYILYFIIIFFLSIVFTTTNNNFNSLTYVLSELKIICLLMLPYFFITFLNENDFDKTIILFCKSLLFLCLFTSLFGILMLNETRYTGPLGLSIYLSYILIFIFYYYYEYFPKKWQFLIFIDLILLGSKMGFILFFIVYYLKQKDKSLKFSFFLLSPLLIIILYYYGIYVRGQDISDFKDIDRFLILEATITYIKNHFEFYNYLFGYGIGNELVGFKTSSPAFNTWFNYTFTHGHVYPYALHNEFFRILFDYGILGLVLIITYLYKNNIPILILIFAMMTNSVLFSSHLIFFLSIFIAKNHFNKEFK